ncbi:hypothetical protein PTTG_10294, partial [Puccinia triticina 1-1 BBBD Race 1]
MSQNLDNLSASMKEANPVSPSEDADVKACLTRSQAADPAAKANFLVQLALESPPNPQAVSTSAQAKVPTAKKAKPAKATAKPAPANPNPKEPAATVK